MTFNEYLEFDKLVWKYNPTKKPSKRLIELNNKWRSLNERQKNDFINKKYRLQGTK